MAADLTTLSNVLKDLYLGPIQEQLQNEILFLNRVSPKAQELVGNQAVIPLHTSRTGGIGSRGEGDALPTDGNQGYRRLTYDLKYHYGRVKISGVAMLKTRSDAGAFLRGLQSEFDGLKQDLQKDLSRQVYGDGTAALATITTGSTTTVINLSSAEAIVKGFVYPNQRLDVGTLANPTSRGTNTVVQSVSATAATVTVSPAITAPTTGEFIFRNGNAEASSVSNEMTGLQQVISTSTGTTLGGLSATTEPLWDNQRKDNGSAPINLDNIQVLIGQCRVAGGKPSAAITSYGIQRGIFNVLQSQVRYMEPTKLEGGFDAITYSGFPIIADVDAPWGRLYLLDEAQLRVFSPEDWHFLEEDGKTLKWVSGFDQWEAVMRRAMQIGAVRRNTSGVLYNITDTNGV